MKIFFWIAACLLLCSFEEPKYTVLSSNGDIELREYPALIAAEVTMKAPRKEALKEGFRLLADYIFGINSTKQKIAMTAPVTEQLKVKGLSAFDQKQLQGGEWVIRFILPKEYTLENAPKPLNTQISLVSLPPAKIAAIRFSGRTSDENIAPQLKKLQIAVEEKKLNVIGNPLFAYYNPPWTLPFLRRNEILVPYE